MGSRIRGTARGQQPLFNFVTRFNNSRPRHFRHVSHRSMKIIRGIYEVPNKQSVQPDAARMMQHGLSEENTTVMLMSEISFHLSSHPRAQRGEAGNTPWAGLRSITGQTHTFQSHSQTLKSPGELSTTSCEVTALNQLTIVRCQTYSLLLYEIITLLLMCNHLCNMHNYLTVILSN